LTGCGSLRLRGARSAGHHARSDRPLVLSGRARCLTRARAHSLIVRVCLRLPQQQHFRVAGRRRRGRPLHVALVDRRAGDVTAPQRLERRVFIGGDAQIPRLPPLDAVIVAVALGDLALLVLRLARGAPFLRRGLVAVKNHLLRERCLGRNEVGALQLQWQEGVKVSRGRQAPRR
jgi:hypothetical protein